MATGALLRIRSTFKNNDRLKQYSPPIIPWFRSLSTTSISSSSVSPEEVSKFSSMSSIWWDASQNPLLSMNPIRIQMMLQVLRDRHATNDDLFRNKNNNSNSNSNTPLRGLRALDVGCGGGVLSESLARLGAQVTAIDPSEEIVQAARARSESSLKTIDYRGGVSVEDLAASDVELFDVVCVLEVIEHTDDPQSLLRAATQLLKRPSRSSNSNNNNCRGGTLFVSTINRTPKSFALGIVGAEYVLGMLPVGTHDWNRFQSPEEVERLVTTVENSSTTDTDSDNNNNNKLVQLDVCGMVACPDVFSKSLSSPKWSLDPQDLDVNWIGAYGFQNERA